MARPYRLQAENTLYHIISRGNDHTEIYRTPRDYQKFLGYCEEVVERFHCRLYAYVLMSNHYHLLLETRQANLSKSMQFLNTAYTTYYNRKHARIGHLFQGRYKSIIVDKDNYLLVLSRYIHLNPVKAGMVADAAEYPWSSYRYYELGLIDTLIDSRELLSLVGMKSPEYLRYVREGVGGGDPPLPRSYAGIILGSGEFIERTLQKIRESAKPKDISFRRALEPRSDTDAIIRAVVKYCGKDVAAICASAGRPQEEKKLLVYVLRRYTELSNAAVGTIVGMRASAVSKARYAFEQELRQDTERQKMVQAIISSFEG